MSLWLFVVRFGHWVCGESWHAIKDFTHAPVLKAGHLVSYLFMCKCAICVVCVLGWRVGGGG